MRPRALLACASLVGLFACGPSAAVTARVVDISRGAGVHSIADGGTARTTRAINGDATSGMTVDKTRVTLLAVSCP